MNYKQIVRIFLFSFSFLGPLFTNAAPQDPYVLTLEKKLLFEKNKLPRVTSHIEQLMSSFSPTFTFAQISELFRQTVAHQTATGAQTGPIAPDQVELYDQAQLLLATHLCKKESSLLMQELLKTLATLFNSLEYWQDLRTKPLNYFTSQWPTRLWKNKARTTTVRESISTLKEAVHYYTYYLGAIYHNLYQFDLIQNEPEMRRHLIQTSLLINACIEHDSFEYEKNTALSMQQVYDLLNSAYDRTKNFHTNALNKLEQYLKPGHLQRNWTRYAVLATTGISALTYWHYNKEQVATWTDQTTQAGKKLFYDSVYEPVKNIVDSYFSEKENNKTEKVKKVRESITKARLKIATNLKQHHDKRLRGLLEIELKEKHPTTPQNEIDQMITKIISSGDLTPMSEAMKNSSAYPISTLFNPYGHYIRHKELELRTMLSQALGSVDDAFGVVDDSMDGLEEIIEQLFGLAHQNHVNYQLLLTIPAVITGCIVYLTTRLAWRSFSTSDHFNPLREGLLMVENTLNKYNTKDHKLPFDAQGLILYWVNKLRVYVYYLPKHHQEQFNEDLTQIGSPEFELHQKLGTIDRMYRSYEFLSFGSQKTITAYPPSFFRQPIVRDRSIFAHDAP
jgi:hypothetical protein